MKKRATLKKIGIVFAVFILAVSITAYVGYIYAVVGPYNKVAAQAKALGLPTTAAYPYLDVPDDQNAALLPAFSPSQNKIPPDISSNQPNLNQIKAVVKQFDANALKIQEAAHLPYYQSKEASPFFQDNKLKAWANHFEYRAWVHLEESNLPLVKSDLETIARLAAYLGQTGGDYFSQMEENNALRAIVVEMVIRTRVSPESLAIAKSVLGKTAPVDFERFYKVQTARDLDSLSYDIADWNRSLMSDEGGQKVVQLPVGELVAKAELLKDRIDGLRVLTSHLGSAFDTKKAFSTLDLYPLQPDGWILSGREQMRYLHNNRELESNFETASLDSVQAKLVPLGIAILEYQKKNGYPPITLEDLDTNLNSIDPWTNQNFHYARRRNGFVLYSVGQNLTDDGGKVSEFHVFAPIASTGDIVFQTYDPDQPILGR